MADATILDEVKVAGTSASRRIASIEFLRFGCAVAIVGYHMYPDPALLPYSPLPLFLILTTYFSVGGLRAESFGRFVSVRFQRIGMPWLAACVFYGAVEAVLRRDWTAPLIPDGLASLLIGPTIHLWFLPYVILTSIPLAAFVWFVRGSGARTYLLAAALVAPAAYCFHLRIDAQLPDPFGQWAYSTPAVFYGAIASLARRNEARFAPALFIAPTGALALAIGDLTDLSALAFGAALFEAARRIDLRSDLMEELGRLAFGIYLSHPFFMLVYFKFFPVEQPAFGIAAVAFMSTACTAALLRTPVLRRLL